MTKEEFKIIRKKLGLTQSELAELLYYQNKTVICNIEAGRYPIGDLYATCMHLLEQNGVEFYKRYTKEDLC